MSEIQAASFRGGLFSFHQLRFPSLFTTSDTGP